MNNETGPEDCSDLIIPDTPTEAQLDAIQVDQIVSANDDMMHVMQKHEVDRMGLTLPTGAWFGVSGKNASRLYCAIGIALVIAAFGRAVSMIIEALK